METTFTNNEVKAMVNDQSKRYGGITSVSVNDKFKLPTKPELASAIQVRESESVYADRQALEAAVTSAKARSAYSEDEKGFWKRKTKYLVVACPEGDLAFGTLCSAAAYNGNETEFKTAAAASVTKDCKGRGTQVVEWLENHAGKTLQVKFRKEYTIVTKNSGEFKSNLTTFKQL